MPNSLRIGRSGAAPAYIRAVSNTGRMPCGLHQFEHQRVRSRDVQLDGLTRRHTRDQCVKQTICQVGVVRKERPDLAADAAWTDHAISRQQPVTSYRQGRAPGLCRPVPHESTTIVREEGRDVLEKLGCCLPHRT
jgi:hypothetical protein